MGLKTEIIEAIAPQLSTQGEVKITRDMLEDHLRRFPLTNRHVWRMIAEALPGGEYNGNVISSDIPRNVFAIIAHRVKQLGLHAVPVHDMIEDLGIKLDSKSLSTSRLEKVAFNYCTPVQSLENGEPCAEIEFNKIVGYDMGEAGLIFGNLGVDGVPTYTLGSDTVKALQYGIGPLQGIMPYLGPSEVIKAGYLGIYENVSDIRAPRDGFSSIVPF